MNTEFSQNLISFRKAKGWTQKESAYNLGKLAKEKIKLSRYQAWEEGRSEPRYYLLIFLSQMFGKNINSLVEK